VESWWQIGEVRVGKAVEMEAPLPGGGAGSMIPAAYPEAVAQMPWLVPDWATQDGLLHLAVQAILVETPTSRLVVDTCVGNGKRRTSPLFDMLDTDFLEVFETVSGWSVGDVDGVLCTHLHVDHVGWNTRLVDSRWVPTFPNARHYICREEMDHWVGSPEVGDARELLADSVQPLLDAGLVDLVTSDQQLFPEVALMATPGHTPGQFAVEIESDGERAIITGDLIHHPCQIGRPDWHSDFDTDAGQATDTRGAVLDAVADTSTILIGTHFGGPTAGRVIRRGDGLELRAVEPSHGR